MNEKEKLIIPYLRKNPRFTLVYLSKAMGMPASTIFDKIKSFDGKIIKKTTCIVDFGKLGFNTKVKIALGVDKEERETIQKFLFEHPNTNSLFKINSGFDFMVECVFRDIKELNDFINTLHGQFNIQKCQVFHVIDDIKREEFLAEPEAKI